MKYDVINEGSGKFGKRQDRKKTGRREGKIEGEAIGIKNTLSLIQKLMENGHLEEIKKFRRIRSTVKNCFGITMF